MTSGHAVADDAVQLINFVRKPKAIVTDLLKLKATGLLKVLKV